jgi:hypothetical protein
MATIVMIETMAGQDPPYSGAAAGCGEIQNEVGRVSTAFMATTVMIETMAGHDPAHSGAAAARCGEIGNK